MTSRGIKASLSGLMGSLLVSAAAASGQVPPEAPAGTQVEMTREAGGTEFRLATAEGIVYVWEPPGYSTSTAGVVIYIHGYFQSVDQAWSEDKLAAQFLASGRNALFIVPQAPADMSEDVCWKSLPGLLEAVEQGLGIKIPSGPCVVIAHSGGFRTVLDWLGEPRVRWLILLDALYNGQPQFRAWLRGGAGANAHHIVLVANDTHRACARFARRFRGVVRRRGVPQNVSGFAPRERQARLFYLRSQYDHTAIVSSGKVIPVVLQLTPLRAPGESADLPRSGASHRKSKPARRSVHRPRHR